MGARADADFPEGGGEMGALMRATDWSATPLGPVAAWPTSLRTMVSVVVDSRFPMLLWWGDELIQLYNDAYRPILGAKHPSALGAPGRDVWREVWDVLGPMAEGVRAGGPATWSEHLHLPMSRHGFVEETFFTFSYSPVPDDQGRRAGVLVTVQETTAQVYGERQLRLLRDLAESGVGATSPEDVARRAAAAIAHDPNDVPFALVYLLDPTGTVAQLAGATGLPPGPTRPDRIELRGTDAADGTSAADRGGWPLADAFRGGGPEIDDVSARFGEIRAGAYGDRIERALVLPLAGASDLARHGVLVAGVSPRRSLDAAYRDVFASMADRIVSAITNAGVLHDARTRAEELARIDRAKTAFFSNVSHELRTPLTLILGPTEDAIGAERALGGEELRAVHRNTLRLRKLVDGLLDFARIEAGRVDARFEPVDLAELTVDLASTFRAAMERAGLRYEVDAPPASEPVYVDRSMWEKIVLNLLSNALKYTLEGSVTVRMRQDRERAQLVVEDTGVGVSADELPRLFERFHRVEGSRARSEEGSGIGLALVQELVRMHGGEVRVESELGRGTRFVLEIPTGAEHLRASQIVTADAAPRRGEVGAAFVAEALRWLPEPMLRGEAGETAEPGPAPRPRVVVADDNADMREYIQRLLESRYDVVAVPNGGAALREVSERGADLVLTDVMMPELDGFELLRALRSHPECAQIPVIMLSARAGEEARLEGVDAGADDYLVKPFTSRDLVARVGAHLEIARGRAMIALERQRLYDAIVQAPAGICVLRGPEHVVALVNDEYLRLVNRTSLPSKPLREAMPELEGQQFIELLDRVYQTGQVFVAREMPADVAGGNRRYFDFTYQPVRNARGDVEDILVHVLDATANVEARHRIEQLAADAEAARARAEEAARAKDEFLAMLGHELRNPLAPIHTALQLMRLRGVTGGERERTVIERQVTHLTHLVDDLLDVSRVTRGKVELARERVETSSFVARAIEMASPILEQRGHDLAVDVVAKGLPVNGDPTRLAQVVANLLTNAAKYTPARGRVEIEARHEGPMIAIRVRDTGVGISSEMLPRVFDAFAQERQAIDRSEGGLGLGLAIVRNLVALHGGTVQAESPGRGKGSVFTIRVPAAAGTSDAPRPEARAAGVPEPSRTGLRVLVVDDNVDGAEMLATLVESLGHDTRVALDGLSALEIAEDMRPDVALLDLGLPAMDGYEVARRFQERPELARTRLVAVTGYGQESDLDRTRAAGFALHLVKPVDLPQLESFLSSSRVRRET